VRDTCHLEYIPVIRIAQSVQVVQFWLDAKVLSVDLEAKGLYKCNPGSGNEMST
jgi:hypothetical protein